MTAWTLFAYAMDMPMAATYCHRCLMEMARWSHFWMRPHFACTMTAIMLLMWQVLMRRLI